jgi:hypothetical protein
MSNPLINVERKLNQGKLANAHKLHSRVLKKEPDNPKAQYQIGETLLPQSRTNESITHQRKAVGGNQTEPCLRNGYITSGSFYGLRKPIPRSWRPGRKSFSNSLTPISG